KLVRQTGAILVNQDAAAASSDIVLIALRSNAEYLQGLIPEAKVVKGFNVLSAYALENGGLQGSKEVIEN
ncbi:Metalloreductase STEAP4, partial [Armadillidium nasatum]